MRIRGVHQQPGHMALTTSRDIRAIVLIAAVACHLTVPFILCPISPVAICTRFCFSHVLEDYETPFTPTNLRSRRMHRHFFLAPDVVTVAKPIEDPCP